MIPHREILALRDEWSLRADVIEKDWALGWVLAGIAAHPQLSTWIFQGGTCLRRSYYETYRFSEDLDFTVVGDGPAGPEKVTPIFREVATWLAETTGVDLLVDERSFVRRRNLRGQDTLLGRVAYRGPSNPPVLPKLKIDVTGDELVLNRHVPRQVLHHEFLVVRDLRDYAKALEGHLSHFRDPAGSEVDAIVTCPAQPWGALEVMVGTVAANLLKFAATRRQGRVVPDVVIDAVVRLGHHHPLVRAADAFWARLWPTPGVADSGVMDWLDVGASGGLP